MIVLRSNKQFQFEYYSDDQDNFIGNQIANNGYEPFESQLFLENLRENSILLDIGANIGYYTILGSKIIKSGQIFSFEPFEPNFHLLEMNILKNRISNAVALQLAASSDRGRTKLFIAPDNHGDHQLYQNSDRLSIDVNMVSIDQFISEQHVFPDVIKIDTQGYDFRVLQKMSNLISNSNNLVVFIEFWNLGNRNAGIDPIKYFDFLETSFKSIEFIDEMNHVTFPTDYSYVEIECSKYGGINHANLICKK